jgi:hypothetical protein
MWYLLRFHSNNGCTNAPKYCYTYIASFVGYRYIKFWDSAGNRALTNCYLDNGANSSLIFRVSSRSFNQYSQHMCIQDCLKGNKIRRDTGLSPLKVPSLYICDAVVSYFCNNEETEETEMEGMTI